MNVPEIVTADSKDLERVKGVLKLGFASDTLVRWVFPDAANYLKSFDVWMKNFLRSHMKMMLCMWSKILPEHLFGIPQEQNLMRLL